MGRYIDALIGTIPELNSLRESIELAVDTICSAAEDGKVLFVAGNGGSMSDALHISGELLKAFRIERRGFQRCFQRSFQPPSAPLQPGIPVWVLGNNPSLSSAVGNDFSEPRFEFAQELYAAGKEGDVFLGISTSGKARNIQNAMSVAGQLGITTISLTGNPGEPMSRLSDVSICVPGADTAEIQECHIKVYHAICSEIEEVLFGKTGTLSGIYRSEHREFDFARIRTYSIGTRNNRTDLKTLQDADRITSEPSREQSIALTAQKTFDAWMSGKPVIIMTGAHLIKNGLSPLLIDLIQRGIPRVIAVNGACAVHDVELALCGGTSENVAEVLPKGEFGFAQETAYIVNKAYREAYKRRMGAGETLGAIIAGEIPIQFNGDFPFRRHSIFYSAFKKHVPVTVHAGIGTDIVDQHPTASFEAKGYASGVDFGIFAESATKLCSGGVVLNIGDAVTHPEVLLKSVSMAANIGKSPSDIFTAVFDLQEINMNDMQDEGKPSYYRRDIKSVVVRIPKAFGGKGYYIQGNQKNTFVEYYAHLKHLIETRK